MLTKQNYHHVMLKLKKQVVEEHVYEYMLLKKKKLTAICIYIYVHENILGSLYTKLECS